MNYKLNRVTQSIITNLTLKMVVHLNPALLSQRKYLEMLTNTIKDSLKVATSTLTRYLMSKRIARLFMVEEQPL